MYSDSITWGLDSVKKNCRAAEVEPGSYLSPISSHLASPDGTEPPTVSMAFFSSNYVASKEFFLSLNFSL